MDTFQRIEKKFWMSREQYEAMLPVLDKYMQKDQYGLSQICNIYYDTEDYSLIRRSIERPYFKEKLRLRSYGYPSTDSKVFVELKRKLDGIGYKRRISLSFDEAKRLIQGDENIQGSDPQIAREILEFVHRYKPKPQVDLTYQRIAMYGKEDPDLRITLDFDLKYRTVRPDQPNPEEMQPIMENPEVVLLEVKAMGGIPDWLKDSLSRLQIYQAPFSKIGTCYTRHIASNLRYSEKEERFRGECSG